MTGDAAGLLSRFRAGERDAILAVIRLARGVIGHRGYYIPRAEQDDLVQEVLLQAYRAVVAPAFRPTRAFEAFVRSVAQRRCIDWGRLHRPSEPVGTNLAAPDPDPEHDAISVEMRSRIRSALSSLGYSCRMLIRMRVRDGLSYREIAHRLGRTEQGVRAQMYKCLKKARTWIETASGQESGRR